MAEEVQRMTIVDGLEGSPLRQQYSQQYLNHTTISSHKLKKGEMTHYNIYFLEEFESTSQAKLRCVMNWLANYYNCTSVSLLVYN